MFFSEIIKKVYVFAPKHLKASNILLKIKIMKEDGKMLICLESS